MPYRNQAVEDEKALEGDGWRGDAGALPPAAVNPCGGYRGHPSSLKRPPGG
jgi:hypothetical protein